ncbi:hypothetical protein BDZ97DRAFT_1754587 [Flammula alnicola]|nr:hypothetical protein BDZ97DRAFT_1754587 [Flammula alnicola]
MSSTSNPNLISPPSKRTHRKRISALRLSSDTTSTLPEYIPTAGWHHQHHQQQQSRLGEENAGDDPLDKPPDYPDSAEEADEDTDTDSNVFYAQPLSSPVPRPNTASPRRAKRFLPTHKRRQSSQLLSQTAEPSDPYLDSLLERSVHALEMSNTLLQSSISTQTSLSAILASDSPGDSSLEARAVGLSSRIRDGWDARETWANDLEEITKDVEGLFSEEPGSGSRRSSARAMHLSEGSISASLPSSSSFPMRRNGRRPSLDLRQASDESVESYLPPPRALTQYVASTQDAESILLPSTIGLRSTPSVHHTPDWRPLSRFASSSMTSLLSTASLSTPTLPPKLTDKPLEPSTRAYNMLSSFVYRAPSSGSATPSTSFTHSFMSRRRDSSSASTSTERSNGNARRRSSPSPASHKSPDRIHRQDRYSGFGAGSASAVPGCSRTQTRGVSPLPVRPMTPPVEESSSSSSDSCVAKRTVQSLRKILDDQPTPPTKSSAVQPLRAPAFMPRTPAPVAASGTSTATASVSRLFTKGTHSSSTRAPSPPRQSAMKRSNNNSTESTPPLGSTHATPSPTPSPTTLSIPDLVGRVLKGGSAPSSGQSTPSKRISFAQLPESYASTRPASSRFKDKQARRKRKSGEGGKSGKGRDEGSASPELGGWWGGWLTGGGSGLHGLGASLARHEERMEDRMTRSWGGRMNSSFGGGLDEWAV